MGNIFTRKAPNPTRRTFKNRIHEIVDQFKSPETRVLRKRLRTVKKNLNTLKKQVVEAEKRTLTLGKKYKTERNKQTNLMYNRALNNLSKTKTFYNSRIAMMKNIETSLKQRPTITQKVKTSMRKFYPKKSETRKNSNIINEENEYLTP